MYQNFIKPLFFDVRKFILDTLFPITCLACEREGLFICPDCQSLLTKLEHQRCIACQKPTPFGLTHPKCQTPHGADGLISFYDYHDKKVANIIIKGKYNFLPTVFATLGKIIATKLSQQYPNILISKNIYRLVPIPLSRFRLRWRGFNQAEILCQAISQELGLAITPALIRKKLTKTQKDLKKEARQKNIQGAFAISKYLNIPISNKNFILVDDVTTTGATLQEAAAVLKRNGANQVICLTVARD